MSKNNIILKNVTKRFGKSTAVDNLSLEVPANAFISLLGPSGCGKTTTLRMIAGLESPTEGEIWIGDKLVFSAQQGIDVPPNHRGIGFLFQNYALWPHMTVEENISFGLENLKWTKSAIRDKVDELCNLLQLSELLGRYPSELSGGQQQRVAIARTLATDPSILLMDEPLSNLDAKLRLEMRTELKRLHSTTSATFVYVTHDQLEAMALSTAVCLMDTAVLQQYAAPLTLYAEPVNRFVADFVGNPTINFMEFTSSERLEDRLCLDSAALKLNFIPNIPMEQLPPVDQVTIGIRPENITIGSEVGQEAKVISSFPYGMETTVIIDYCGLSLRAVVFGSINFQVGEVLKISMGGNNSILFDKRTDKALTLGRLELCN